jgi:lipid II:glycine glycyltransferase (peptidoglycan interpeptide bridge formation enzyme)
VVEDRTPRGFDDFMAIRQATAERQGLDLKRRRYFASIVDEFGPGAHLFFAELDGRRLATAMVLRFGERATYFFGGSLPERRDTMAPYLLHHEIMNRMAVVGCVCYDLWGTSPPGESDHPWNAISEFKRKFGGSELEFVPTLDRVYDAAAYARFIETEGESGDSASVVGVAPEAAPSAQASA